MPQNNLARQINPVEKSFQMINQPVQTEQIKPSPEKIKKPDWFKFKLTFSQKGWEQMANYLEQEKNEARKQEALYKIKNELKKSVEEQTEKATILIEEYTLITEQAIKTLEPNALEIQQLIAAKQKIKDDIKIAKDNFFIMINAQEKIAEIDKKNHKIKIADKVKDTTKTPPIEANNTSIKKEKEQSKKFQAAEGITFGAEIESSEEKNKPITQILSINEDNKGKNSESENQKQTEEENDDEIEAWSI